MKKRYLKSLFLVTITVTNIVTSSLLVSATEVENKEEHPIESVLIDKNGNKITIYDNELNLEDAMEDSGKDSFSSPASKNTMSNGRISLFSAKKKLTYHSSLTPYNNCSYVRAQSEANDAIDSMYVSCTGYYKSGKTVKTVIAQSPAGWKVQAYSAKVEVPKSAFPLKVNSANSYHLYKNKGYKNCEKRLKWNK